MVALVPTDWAASSHLPNPVWPTLFYSPFLPPKLTGYLRAFDAVLGREVFFPGSQRRAAFQGTLVRGSPASVYPESTYSTGVYSPRHMYDILAPLVNSF